MAIPFLRTTRSLANDSPRYAYVAWGVAALLLLGWVLWFSFSQVVVYEISRKARLEVMRSPHTLTSTVAGTVRITRLELGQIVREGEVLVELDTQAERLRLQEEETRSKALPMRVASLKKELTALEQAKLGDKHSAEDALRAAQYRSKEAGAAAEFAKETARRLKEESNAGSVARVEAERASSEARKLLASNEALMAEAHRLENDASARAFQSQAHMENLRRTLVGLESDIATSEASVARLKQEIDKHLIRAPTSGRIGEIAQLKAGAYVAEGQKFATIVPGGEVLIVAEFDPAAVLGRIHPGQTSRMRLDAFPWAQYGSIEATVTRVGSEIRDNMVRVELMPVMSAATNHLLQHGLPGTVEISVERTAPALLVLRAAGRFTPASNAPQL